jgi:hypothetical protein
MKKAFISFLTLIFLFGSALAIQPSAFAAGKIVDEGYVAPDLPIKGTVSVNFRDGRNFHMDAGAPYLTWNSAGTNAKGYSQTLLCNSLLDAACKRDNGYFEFFTRLISCPNDETMDCIEEISAETAGRRIVGEYLEPYPKKIMTTYLSDASMRLPRASSAALWKFDGLEHAGGNQYFLDATLRGRMNVGESAFSNTSLGLSLYAASLKPLGVHTSSPETGSKLDDGSSYVIQNFRNNNEESFLGAVGIYGGYQGETLDCVMSGDSLCANRHALPEGVKFSIKLRLSSSPSGWLHGRLDQPEVSIADISPKPSIKLTISGVTTRVPAVGHSSNWVELPTQLRDIYTKGGFQGTAYGCRWCSDDPLLNTLTINPPASGQGAIDELKLWLPLVKEQSSADINTWSIRTLSIKEMSGADRCFVTKNQINGLVMTNSTVYSAGPPLFESGTLNYQVAAPHYMSNGDVFKGQYNLVMRSDVARCVYNFSKAPIQASISVINSDGAAQVATMVMGERDGWLYLGANNFEFSSPVVKVKLSQEAAPVPKTEATPAPTKAPAPKKVSITCQKGKVKKKVVGIKPSCPAGFKKVAS